MSRSSIITISSAIIVVLVIAFSAAQQIKHARIVKHAREEGRLEGFSDAYNEFKVRCKAILEDHNRKIQETAKGNYHYQRTAEELIADLQKQCSEWAACAQKQMKIQQDHIDDIKSSIVPSMSKD